MSQPYPSSGQPAGPLRPAPAPVRTAVTLMYAGAAVSTVTVIIALALIPAIKAALRAAHPSLTTAQVSDVNTLITLAMVFGLAVIALWLWMARAAGQGKNWARILCAAAASTIMGELRGSADHAPATNLYYPGAGHYYFGFPPYFPFFTSTEVAGQGGSAQADALATEQFWTRMITFLNHLAIHRPPAVGMPQEP